MLRSSVHTNAVFREFAHSRSFRPTLKRGLALRIHSVHVAEVSNSERSARVLGMRTATFLIIAMMIGTGIFTTSGFLLSDIGSRIAVLLAWAVGGVAAIAGALCYAELGAAYPHNGGEYLLVSRLVHPAAGFGAAIASLLAGFAAPLAGSAMAFEAYTYEALGRVVLPEGVLASATVVFTSFAFSLSRRHAFGGQDLFTALKLALMLAFVALGLAALVLRPSQTPTADAIGLKAALSAPFAAGLVYVAYAYLGWNTAIYVAGEVRAPKRTLPRSVLLGAGAVAVLYLLITTVIIYSAPSGVLAASGKTVTHVAATNLFGAGTARWVSAIIAIGLVSNVGALVAAGPPVTAAVGTAMPRLRVLAARTRSGTPWLATILQALIALVLLWTASFDAILVFVGASLTVSSAVTVLGLFVHRKRGHGDRASFRTPLYPLPPLVFLALALWMLVFATLEKPEVLAWTLAIYAGSAIGYAALREPKTPKSTAHN